MSRIVTHATAPSHFLLNTLTNCGFFSHAQLHVIPNSHALTEPELARISQDVQAQPANSSLNILYLGRLEEVKGVQLLLDTFTKPEIKQCALHLNIVGWGTMEAVVADTCSAHPHMHFHGALFGEEKQRLLLSADILLVPSLCAEAFGIVIVEAFAYGIPVIASRVGAIAELVEDEVTGFLIAPGDSADLVKTVIQLTNNATVLSRMRLACLKQAQNYSVKLVTDQYLALY
ncbi:MAG: glycosyltransferase [Anaerolineae bacterium]|nr:glycosyltransferase [Anaerolineae bacterium]